MNSIIQCLSKTRIHSSITSARYTGNTIFPSCTRCFTSTQYQPEDLTPEQGLQDFNAALPLEADNAIFNHEKHLLKRIRVIPASPSYYSAKERFTDTFLKIDRLWLQTKTLPRTTNAGSLKWIKWEDVKERYQDETTVKKTNFQVMLYKLRQLSLIEPALMPPEVQEVIEQHSSRIEPPKRDLTAFRIDEWGRSLGMGKRKTSVARAFLVMGDGQVLVNERNLTDYFVRVHDRESALWPLKITDRIHKYNVFGIVTGGGITGQAEAMTLAVAKALIAHEPHLAGRLKNAGCFYRDPRAVERKKPGLRKARKAPQWIKR